MYISGHYSLPNASYSTYMFSIITLSLFWIHGRLLLHILRWEWWYISISFWESKAESSLKESSLVDQMYDFSWHGGRRCSPSSILRSLEQVYVESSFLNMNHTNHFSNFRTCSIASGTTCMLSLIVEVFVGGRWVVSFCYNSLTKR